MSPLIESRPARLNPANHVRLFNTFLTDGGYLICGRRRERPTAPAPPHLLNCIAAVKTMTIQDNVLRRAKTRTRVLMTATVTSPTGSHKVLVRDISRHGAQIYAYKGICAKQDACFSRGPIFVAARIVWCRRGEAGLEFYRELSLAELADAFHPGVSREAGA